jgi:protocatechuate 3,4-dioxygenase beta subunit
MERRKFFKDTGVLAIGIGILGKVSWNGNMFVGDTETTTDILGPFYRPGAPVRSNINSKEYGGKLFHLSGTVFKEDGKTPFKNCQVEIWQCDEHGVYDNTSPDYRYRGAQKTGANGKYHFIGMHPIPYPLAEGSSIYRPAHIHLLISGEGQQDLITQIYLEGDPHLEKDMGSMSRQATKRILKISRNSNNEEAIRFDIVMAKEFKPDNAVFEKLAGVYKMNDKSVMEFYKKDDLLFFKWNSQIWEGLSYKGNNTFSGGSDNSTVATFELLTNSTVKIKVNIKSITRGEVNLEGNRILNYSK